MLNSAPVQLLPVENGSGYNNNASKKEPQKIKDRKFDDVLDTEMKRGSVKEKEKTVKPDKKELKAAEKDSGEKSVDESEEQTASAAAGMKNRIETAVRNLKKSLAASDESPAKDGQYRKTDLKDSGPVLKTDTKKSDLLLQLQSRLAAENAEGRGKKSGLKTAEKNAQAISAKNGDIVEFKLTGFERRKNQSSVFNESAEDKSATLAEVLTFAAEELKSDKKSGKPNTKLSVDFVSASGKKKTVTAEKSAGFELNEKEKKADGIKSKFENKLKVTDARKNVSASAEKVFKSPLAGENLEQKTDSSDALKVLSSSETEAVLDFSKESNKAGTVKNFQSAVVNQLKESLNSQIVKQAGIIVRNDNSGEIKLIMKPENLGKVRIQLSLNDNHIAGRIIVENNIVREIFESNLENLYKAFGAEGFENSGLEVSVEGRGGNQGPGGKNGKQGITSRAVASMEDAIPELVETEWQDNAVNMVV